jgi:hypothetical protein
MKASPNFFMRLAFIAALLIAFLLNVSLPASAGTGSTVISATITGSLGLNISFAEAVLPEDYYFYANVTVYQNDLPETDVYLNKSDANGFVKFVNKTSGGTYYQDDYVLNLGPLQWKNVTLRTYVPAGMGYDGGTYDIYVYANSLDDPRTNSTMFSIKVNNTNPIDDIAVTGIDPSSLYPGQSLEADVSIHKLYPSGMTDIQICYCINAHPDYLCGPSYNNYGCEWKAIAEWLNYTKTVVVTESAGAYYFITAVKYPGDDNIKRANGPQFYVQTPPSGQAPGGPGGPAGAILPAAPQRPELSITAPGFLEASPGETKRFTAEVRNTGRVIANNATLSIYGLPENWASVSPSLRDIGTNASANYSITIVLPETAFEQVYSLSLVAKSGSSETTEKIVLTVATTPSERAMFLLEETRARKNLTAGMLEEIKSMGMDVGLPERNMTIFGAVLAETETLYASGDYGGSITKSTQAITGYESTSKAANDIVEIEYLNLMREIESGLAAAEKYREDDEALESIKHKMSESIVLQKEDRLVEAYKTLLDAKRLLDQIVEKIKMMDTVNFLIMASAVIIIALAVIFLAVYKKKASRFVKRMVVEEQKRQLGHAFKKEVRPVSFNKATKWGHVKKPAAGHEVSHEKPVDESKHHPKGSAETVPRGEAAEKEKAAAGSKEPVTTKENEAIRKEKIEEITQLVRKGSALMSQDAKGAREIFLKVKEAYGSLSDQEKKIIDAEVDKSVKAAEERKKAKE